MDVLTNPVVEIAECLGDDAELHTSASVVMRVDDLEFGCCDAMSGVCFVTHDGCVSIAPTGVSHLQFVTVEDEVAIALDDVEVLVEDVNLGVDTHLEILLMLSDHVLGAYVLFDESLDFLISGFDLEVGDLLSQD